MLFVVKKGGNVLYSGCIHKLIKHSWFLTSQLNTWERVPLLQWNNNCFMEETSTFIDPWTGVP